MAQECRCPVTDGVIRHQRATCTDPAVAGLDWYADELAAMREKCRHGWPGSDCGQAHPYIAEPTSLPTHTVTSAKRQRRT